MTKTHPGPDKYTFRRVLGLIVILSSIVAALPLHKAEAPVLVVFCVVMGGVVAGFWITGD